MKIPKEAKKVFDGIIFDVCQWQQKMYDGSYQTFEMLKRPMTVEVIATSKDKILLGLQSQPNKENFYSFFGGRLEDNEDALEGVKRELLEEAGLESKEWELWKTYHPASKIEWDVHLFIARNCTHVAKQNLDSGERIEIKEFSFEEFVDLVLHNDNFRDYEFTLDLFRMRERDKLEEFKKKLFES